ncbi:MAG: hypothetical protein JWP65_856 [Ramlibacter sp.]|uniref:hypothetical protein n=1 Tax=Ramlibacter sp. TaxID=1917967 RepID=UPI00261CDB5B|nr:hypothetical protein [Ramlibacter sp.]MDB5750435.1 hypothetical protein [Ramlibacter sp.]
MADHQGATTTEAVAADAASRVGEEPGAAGAPFARQYPGEGRQYAIGMGVLRAAATPHERKADEPLYRSLRIYAVDPAHTRLEGAVANVNVAYEPLEPGPVGKLIAVDDTDPTGRARRKADLDERNVLIADGYEPSLSDPRFHQQMVYAVCSNAYSAFRTALGRTPSWSFGGPDEPARLIVRPHHARMRNAYYERVDNRGELHFGYFPAGEHPTDRTMAGGIVFTCLSHDIVVHEMTHALLDGLRAHFMVPTNPDVIAFHEAFADLVAVFQHFSYPDVVRSAIRQCRGALEQAALLAQVASQFSRATGRQGPLRTALEHGEHREYRDDLEPHALGAVLVSAIFEAFSTVFRRKTEAIVRLATGGTGVLPPGELPHDLQQLLAAKAGKLASQFLAICIRAIDYCPPTGMMFGDYLRALITADYDLVPDDPWDYRGALVDAFWRRRIYPRTSQHLSQDSLLWQGPRVDLPPVAGLDFATLRFQGDPAQAASVEELRRQAAALGHFVTERERLEEFGLAAQDDPRLGPNAVGLPTVESIRTARRAGPNGQIVFDLVAEITQAMHVAPTADGPGFTHHGGCTVLLSPKGEVRYVVLKSVLGAGRVDRRRDFLMTNLGQRFWRVDGDRLQPRGSVFRLMHEI